MLLIHFGIFSVDSFKFFFIYNWVFYFKNQMKAKTNDNEFINEIYIISSPWM